MNDFFNKTYLAAKNGNIDAKYVLAKLYEEGKGVKRNLSKALKIYEELAKKKHTDSCYRLGMFYKHSSSSYPDELEGALKYFTIAAKNGHLKSQYEIANYHNYRRKQAYEYSREEIFDEFLKLAKKGCLEACCDLYILAHSYKNFSSFQKTSLNFLREAACTHNHACSQYLLASHYLGLDHYDGYSYSKYKKEEALNLLFKAASKKIEVKNQLKDLLLYGSSIIKHFYSKDKRKVFNWWLKEAEKDSYAQFVVAICYHKGIVVEKDLDKAIYWSRKSVKENIEEYLIFLAICLDQKGEQLEAIEWYKKAAAKGSKAAKYELAYFNETFFNIAPDINFDPFIVDDLANSYLQGKSHYNKYFFNRNYGGRDYEGGSHIKDTSKAIYWLKKSNTVLSMYDLGFVYLEEFKYEEALYWFEKSAELGYSYAQNMVGDLYYKGKGTEKNIEKARFWLEKAAFSDQENVEAMNDLAYLYSNDFSSDESLLIKAFELFLKAARLGDHNAMWNVALCYKDGEGTEKNLEEASYWFTKSSQGSNKEGLDEIFKELTAAGAKEVTLNTL